MNDVCPHCDRGSKDLHIGKSSAGWCFSLHVDPELGINNLGDWRERWKKEGTAIVDEYGEIIEPTDMLRIITERYREQDWKDHTWFGYDDEDDFHQSNHSERGPNGLLRHKIDGHCIGHGCGTYDYITGEFS
jgi:hypothetical protein